MKSNPLKPLEANYAKLGLNPYTTIFHHDAGHGWYQVHKDVLKAFGIADEISRCSYQKGNMVYLEEDCDAPLLFRSAIACGFRIDVVNDVYHDESPVRNYQSYQN